MRADEEKRAAAEAAVEYVEDHMVVGLGTGTTVAFLLPALAERNLEIRCVATSPQTRRVAEELGLRVEPFHDIAAIDVAIDGADQVTPEGWLIKGGGGAHTREKIVAKAARRFVVIVSSEKLVANLSSPVPLELLEFGIGATMAALGDVRLRAAPQSPDGGVLADWFGDVGDPEALAARFAAQPGVVEHGLFSPSLVADILIGSPDGVRHRQARG